VRLLGHGRRHPRRVPARLRHGERARRPGGPRGRQGLLRLADHPPALREGEFVGGCDIIRELHQTGELTEVLGQKPIEVSPPSVTLSDAAIAAFKEAQAEEEHKDLRLEITARFQYALSFGPELKGDVVVEQGGLTVRMDRGTARRADGMRIDFITGPEGSGFKIDNPNEPPSVQQIGPQELKAKLDDGSLTHLYDVRPDNERAIAKLDAAPQLTDDVAAAIEQLDKDTPIAFLCKSGGRSQRAAEFFLQKGFKEVYNVAGGINAWSREIDDSIPLY
jgi:monothiol glutaredoxin